MSAAAAADDDDDDEHDDDDKNDDDDDDSTNIGQTCINTIPSNDPMKNWAIPLQTDRQFTRSHNLH